MAVEAYVLMRVQGNSVGEAVRRLLGVPGVSAANAVTGPYDVIARVQAGNVAGLTRAVLSRVRTVPGVTSTVTCLVVDVA